jgi:hypothetical protein
LKSDNDVAFGRQLADADSQLSIGCRSVHMDKITWDESCTMEGDILVMADQFVSVLVTPFVTGAWS